MIIKAVGFIRNNINKPFLAAGDSGIEIQGEFDDIRAKIRKSSQETSEIIINRELVGILDGIEQYSHLLVFYWAHKVPEKSRLLTKVHPMGRKEAPLAGIFCTCSPARPNPVLMTVVKLSEVNGNVLKVTGLDAVDGSPVIDIKPYFRESYPQEEVFIPEWMRKLQQEAHDCQK
jgi:tRNA-Thr(GGU) m(6)t(6)A37 methyltransferase TsaA